MTRRRFALLAAMLIAALAIGQLSVGAQADPIAADRQSAADAGLKLGLIPDGLDAFEPADLPDLIPVGAGDEIWGYAYAHEVFVEVFDPNLEMVAYGVYEADGKTLLGHVIPGEGFVNTKTAIETSRPAIIPDTRNGLTGKPGEALEIVGE